MSDKAMDEVMREFRKRNKKGWLRNDEGQLDYIFVKAYIPIVCRAYAVKVLENLIVEKIKMGEISRPVSVPREIIQAEITRLKEKP